MDTSSVPDMPEAYQEVGDADDELNLTYSIHTLHKAKSPESEPSLHDLEMQPDLQPSFHTDATGKASEAELPPTDYYMYETAIAEHELDDDYPIARNIVETGNKFFIERNLYAHLHATYEIVHNYYQDEMVELETLAIRPPTFIIFGKSGVGVSTLAKKMVETLRSVYISPKSVVDYFQEHHVPEEVGMAKIDIAVGMPTKQLFMIIDARIKELDVLHRGYVMDGIPMMMAKDMTVEDQMELLDKLPMKPQFIILMHMQDIDLFRRRSTQKADEQTGEVYTRNQYICRKFSKEKVPQNMSSTSSNDGNIDEDEEENKSQGGVSQGGVSRGGVTFVSQRAASIHSDELIEELSAKPTTSTASKDFPPLSSEVIDRLYSREEDSPARIQESLDRFRENIFHLEKFIDSIDRRKVLELNSYFSPSVLLKNVLEFTDSFGITPTPIPTKLVDQMQLSKMLHFSGEAGEWTDAEGDLEERPCPEEPEKETDWPAVLRACTYRGRVDPRFRWRISRWKNLCPVALKFGKSRAGKPELAVGFMDKVYFMSSENAFAQFKENPRPFLLPKMPSSPVKFYVIGHPLAGKTSFAEHLANRLDATVIDMVHEVKRRMHLVKFDYLFRARLEAVLEMKKRLDLEYFRDWKRQERERRAAVLRWIDDFIRRKADELLNASLELEREEYKKERDAYFAGAMNHELLEPFSSACQPNTLSGFSWNDFVDQIRHGKRNWTHQEILELAWHLFHLGLLKYKRKKKRLVRKILRKYRKRRGDGDSEVSGEEESGEGSSEQESGSSSEDGKNKHKKRKRRRRPPCKKAPKPVDSDDDELLVRVESKESSVFGTDDETDESIKMRYPEIPAALIDSIPRPANVTEKHPLVEDYVLEVMVEAEKWADSNPPELYAEVLRRAIREAEVKYLEKNSHGPLSGGWVVDNLETDIEKWRFCLRSLDIAPDNVITLVDQTPGNATVWTALKQKVRAERHSKELKAYLKDVGEVAHLHMQEAAGEGGEGSAYARPRGPFKFPWIPENNVPEIVKEDVPDYPRDDLTESYRTAASQVSAHQRDRRRQISLADSELDITTDPKVLLKDWFETFDPNDDYKVSEPRAAGLSASPYTRPTPEMEEWITRNVQYEMLTNVRGMSAIASSSRGDDDSALGMAPGEEIPASGVASAEKPTAQNLLDNWPGPGPIPSFFELGNEDDLIRTPSVLLSDPGATYPDGEMGPEGTLSDGNAHPESQKRKFQKQIAAFDEFWNMAIPVLHQEQIRYWEMGVVEEDTIKEKIRILWEDLESRFILPAVRVDERDVIEETEEWEEANKKWDAASKDPAQKEVIGENEEEAEEEESSSDEEPELGPEDQDPLQKLRGKPDEYLKEASRLNEMHLYGDLKDYCPVTLKDLGVVRRGFPRFAAKYRDKLYMMRNEECVKRFIEDPTSFLPIDKPFPGPPPRICITGPPGASQEKVASQMAKEYGVFFVNFRERLQELVKVKVGKKVGPDAFEFNLRGESLLTMQESDSSFDLPAKALAAKSGSTISERQYSEEEYGEGGSPAQRELAKLKIKSLGVSNVANIASCPLSGLEKTETIAGQEWTKTSEAESAIKSFLETGAQLPDFVLDEYVAPLWQIDPFKCNGFVMVGFPNSDEDMRYLAENNLIPEYVYVIDCKPKPMRNRLLMKTVDDWHRNHPTKRKPKADKQDAPDKPVDKSMEDRKGLFLNPNYKNKVQPEDPEGWTYNDSVAVRVSSHLHKFHRLTSKNLRKLKAAMNRYRTNWMPIRANMSLRMAEIELLEQINTSLKYRSSMFETTHILNEDEAKVLLDSGFYPLSKFRRWCPVELSKGNLAVNLWNAPGVKKFPVLYRGYIYFIAGEKNLKHFRENVWETVQQNGPSETMPLFVVINGPPRSGKTTLAKKLEENLGLVRITQEGNIQDIIKHSFESILADQDSEGRSSANVGPQPMKTADEIINYLGRGHKVPLYMAYRALDLSLMAPKAQFHGIVFEDYPLEDVQLQELLERGLVPTVVINLEITMAEQFRRAELKRFDPKYNYTDFTEECDEFIEYSNEDYEPMIAPCLEWYAAELQCLFSIDGTQSPSTIYKAAEARCIYAMNNMQRYIISGLSGKPATLEATGPLTSLIESNLTSQFRNYDPVALNENQELVRIDNVPDISLKLVAEYRGELYVFANEKHVEMFIENPGKYTNPTCLHVVPELLPTAYCLTEAEMEEMEDHWGFLDFDPVHYKGGNFLDKSLTRGKSKFCAEYNHRLYFFINPSNLDTFMRKPQDYAFLQMPAKIPARAGPKPLDKLSPSGFVLGSGLAQDVIQLLTVVAKKRPRFPFTSVARSGVLYMGYYLKTLNMKSSLELRNYYRKAMSHLMTTQYKGEAIAEEIEALHGRRNLHHDTKKRVQGFLNFAFCKEKEDEMLIDPFIPDCPFSYEVADDPETKLMREISAELKRESGAGDQENGKQPGAVDSELGQGQIELDAEGREEFNDPEIENTIEAEPGVINPQVL